MKGSFSFPKYSLTHRLRTIEEPSGLQKVRGHLEDEFGEKECHYYSWALSSKLSLFEAQIDPQGFLSLSLPVHTGHLRSEASRFRASCTDKFPYTFQIRTEE